MPVSTIRAPVGTPTGEPTALNAPLFRALLDKLADGRRRAILDLGAATTPMLELLGRSPCRVEIADLDGSNALEALNAAEPETVCATAAAMLPAHPDARPVDAVFCWDLPNYLQRDGLAALMATVVGRAGPGAVAHALIYFSAQLMPDCPRRFVPTDDCRLVARAAVAGTIEAPRYSPEALERLMGGFAIDSARLLSNGMQEFLFRLPGGHGSNGL